MPLTPGSRLGPYEVTAQVGVGGMGEVYRARDTRLKRDVALKILPESFASDPERLARFQREAEVLASLNHPNIAAIYGLEQSDGVQALVMELVEGPTLADRIAQGPIPVDETLAIANQIAEALEAAHEQGIIHRDLKPANIKVRPDGTVKVLDFGLAKALEPVSAAGVDATASPTITSPAMMTGVGVLLGTAAYMSPEQARGKPVDRRTDIWAFGCVLFEMLAGRKAFESGTVTDTLAAIVRGEPKWHALPAETPGAVRRLLMHCLNKDPRHRLRHIGDAGLALDDAGVKEASAEPATSAAAADSSRRMRALPWAIAGVAVAAGVLAIAIGGERNAPSQPVTRLELSLPADAQLYSTAGPSVAVSPDGTFLAFAATRAASRAAYLHRLDESETGLLPGIELANSLFFSPDSTALAVTASDGTLKTVSLKDGLVTTLSRDVDYNSGGTFGPDGRVLFVRDGALWELPASGGEPKQLTRLDTEREITQRWPLFLPGGRAILFTSFRTGNSDAPRIDAITLADGTRKAVVERAAFPMYLQTGHLMFQRDGALLAAPFDAARLETTAPAVRVVDSVGVTGSGAPMAAVTATGTLVYASAGGTGGRLVWVTRQGVETAINDVARSYAAPRLAPNGQRIVVASETNALWLQDTTRSMLTRLTAPEPDTFWPIWTPDGRRVFYRSLTGLHWIEADGSGRVGTIADTSVQDAPGSVSPDGKTLAFLRVSPDTAGDIYLLPLEGDPKPRPFVNSRAYEGGPRFSPDGRWMAYASNESGQFQIYVRPFPEPERRIPVSTDGGSYPIWNPNGKELFYRNGNRMMAVEISTGALDADLVVSAPKVLFEREYAVMGNTMPGYDISADGQRFVMVKPEADANRLNVVINWFEELKRLVPPTN